MHGAMKKRCSFEGCAKYIVKEEACIMHGATKKRCSVVGCTNQVQNGGVCVTHHHGANLTPKQPPNLVPTLLLPSHQLVNFDDEDELGAWIWRSNQTARDLGVH